MASETREREPRDTPTTPEHPEVRPLSDTPSDGCTSVFGHAWIVDDAPGGTGLQSCGWCGVPHP